MFNTAFLHLIRTYELGEIKRRLPPGTKILEIGGGTGIQAKMLGESGFDVVSMDVPQSQYASERVFPVIEYDGRNLPFTANSFDVVLSSNVLEHVEDLPALHEEIRRVLRPDGCCVHVMPSGYWRFWTNVAHYVELLQRIGLATTGLFRVPRHPRAVAAKLRRDMTEIVKAVLRFMLPPPRHGERGNAFTEIYYFSPNWWRRHFVEHGYGVVELAPLGLFYTGHMVLGSRLSIRTRQRLARLLGSACYLFKVEDHAAPDDE